MDVAIITAIIGGLCVAIPSVIATITSNSKNNALLTYQLSELKADLKALKKEVNAHDDTVGEEIGLIKEQIHSLELRIEKIETENNIVHHDYRKGGVDEH